MKNIAKVRVCPFFCKSPDINPIAFDFILDAYLHFAKCIYEFICSSCICLSSSRWCSVRLVGSLML